MKRLPLEDKGHIGSTGRVFTTNLRHDHLVFVSQASDIKILHAKSGKYIGDIDGAHFKGTYNFGFVVANSLQGKLDDLFGAFQGNHKDPKFMDLIVEQLNNYLMVTSSIKDKIKVWKFDDGLATPISQANVIGGSLSVPISLLYTAAKEVCMLVMGNASNKVELFKLAPQLKTVSDK